MDNSRLIDLKELVSLCGANSPQALLQWLKRNLSKINGDGVHAEKVGKSWLFDSIAVERITGLRGASSSVGVISTTSTKENALQGEISRLTEGLTLAQGIVAQKQDIIIQLQSKLMDNVTLISEAKTTEAQAKAQAQILEERVRLLEQQLSALQVERDRLLSLFENMGPKKKKKKKK